jgi:hypothetical protein
MSSTWASAKLLLAGTTFDDEDDGPEALLLLVPGKPSTQLKKEHVCSLQFQNFRPLVAKSWVTTRCIAGLPHLHLTTSCAGGSTAGDFLELLLRLEGANSELGICSPLSPLFGREDREEAP